jgi:hypothetical protein
MTPQERDIVNRFLSAACERLETRVDRVPVKAHHVWHVIAWLRGLASNPDFTMSRGAR